MNGKYLGARLEEGFAALDGEYVEPTSEDDGFMILPNSPYFDQPGDDLDQPFRPPVRSKFKH